MNHVHEGFLKAAGPLSSALRGRASAFAGIMPKEFAHARVPSAAREIAENKLLPKLRQRGYSPGGASDVAMNRTRDKSRVLEGMWAARHGDSQARSLEHLGGPRAHARAWLNRQSQKHGL